MAAGVSFDSFFEDRVIDNNGVSVTYINVGLNKLHKVFKGYLVDNIGFR